MSVNVCECDRDYKRLNIQNFFTKISFESGALEASSRQLQSVNTLNITNRRLEFR